MYTFIYYSIIEYININMHIFCILTYNRTITENNKTKKNSKPQRENSKPLKKQNGKTPIRKQKTIQNNTPKTNNKSKRLGKRR